MTGEQALAQALTGVAISTSDHPGAAWTWDATTAAAVAAAILGALPEGWMLLEHGACPKCVEDGAQQERERLRGEVMRMVAMPYGERWLIDRESMLCVLANPEPDLAGTPSGHEEALG